MTNTTLDDWNIFLHRIGNDNAGAKMCCHQYCDNKPLFFGKVIVNGLPIFFVLCEEHAKEFEKNKDDLWTKRQMSRKECQHYSVTKHGESVYCNTCGYRFGKKEFEEWDKQAGEHLLITIR